MHHNYHSVAGRYILRHNFFLNIHSRISSGNVHIPYPQDILLRTTSIKASMVVGPGLLTEEPLLSLGESPG